jgi:hypothetical protein
MISNQKPWDDKKKPLDDKKKPLDIYYYLDFDDTYDIDFVERSIDLNVKVYEKDYNVNKITRYNLENDLENQFETNTIKRGLLIFNTMFKKLKLKSTYDVWFIYLSNGYIANSESFKDCVFITLLNKNPSIKKSLYSVNKFTYSIRKNQTQLEKKTSKLEQMRKVNETLKNLITNTTLITYDDLL